MEDWNVCYFFLIDFLLQWSITNWYFFAYVSHIIHSFHSLKSLNFHTNLMNPTAAKTLFLWKLKCSNGDMVRCCRFRIQKNTNETRGVYGNVIIEKVYLVTSIVKLLDCFFVWQTQYWMQIYRLILRVHYYLKSLK